jgi:hypothetical protein
MQVHSPIRSQLQPPQRLYYNNQENKMGFQVKTKDHVNIGITHRLRQDDPVVQVV